MAGAMLCAVSDILQGWAHASAGDSMPDADAAAADSRAEGEEAAAALQAPSDAAWLHALGVSGVLLGGLSDVQPETGGCGDEGSGGFGGGDARVQLAVTDLPGALLLPAMEQSLPVRWESPVPWNTLTAAAALSIVVATPAAPCAA